MDQSCWFCVFNGLHPSMLESFRVPLITGRLWRFLQILGSDFFCLIAQWSWATSRRIECADVNVYVCVLMHIIWPCVWCVMFSSSPMRSWKTAFIWGNNTCSKDLDFFAKDWPQFPGQYMYSFPYDICVFGVLQGFLRLFLCLFSRPPLIVLQIRLRRRNIQLNWWPPPHFTSLTNTAASCSAGRTSDTVLSRCVKRWRLFK